MPTVGPKVESPRKKPQLSKKNITTVFFLFFSTSIFRILLLNLDFDCCFNFYTSYQKYLMNFKRL